MGYFLGAFILAVLAVSLYFLKVATYPKVMPYESSFAYEAEASGLDTDAFHKLEKLELYLKGEGKHRIHGFLIPGRLDKLVIISHGYSLSLASSIKYADMFLNRGYGVFIYDHRNHGLSSRGFTSFGYYEKQDLRRVIQQLRRRMNNKVKIGLLGESLGGATVLQYVAEYDDVDFAIADCPFSDAHDLFKYRMKYDYGFASSFLINATSFLSRLIQGWSFKYVSVRGRLINTQTPVLFIHGEDDKYTPMEMTLELYDEKALNKWLYIAPKARHAKSFLTDPDLYKKNVDDFLNSIYF